MLLALEDPTTAVVDHLSELYTNVMAAAFVAIVATYWARKRRSS